MGAPSHVNPSRAHQSVRGRGDGRTVDQGRGGSAGTVTLYEQGVDLLHIGTYVRRWLRWARSGLRALGEGLSERALELVVRALNRLGWLGGGLPPLLPAVAGPTVGEEGDGPEHR